MQLWFPTGVSPETPADASMPKPYDRLSHLKEIMFDIFADFTTEPPLLDYNFFVSASKTSNMYR